MNEKNIINKENLRKNLHELLTGESTHLSFDKIIKDIPPGKRGTRPTKDIPSIWEELEHMRITIEDIIKYTFSAEWKSPDWPDEYWSKPTEEVSDEQWNATMDEIKKYIKETAELIDNDRIELTSEIPHGEGRTYLREVLLAANHNSYHLSKIVMIRKLLGIW